MSTLDNARRALARAQNKLAIAERELRFYQRRCDNNPDGFFARQVERLTNVIVDLIQEVIHLEDKVRHLERSNAV